MSHESPPPQVWHAPEQMRFAVDVDGERAILDYRLDDSRMIITHTFVPPQLRGGGLASHLVRAALDHVRQGGLKVASECSYVTAFLRRHGKEYADIIS